MSNHSIKSQTTYYYGLTKKIIDGKVSMSISGGQFISFLNEICYESNKNSIGVGHGTLKLNKSYSDSRFKFYMGNSYWGDAATFKFKSDLSVLNVVLENGDVYVYKRQTAPSSVTTCSLIRKRGSSSVTLLHIQTMVMVEVIYQIMAVLHLLLEDRTRHLLVINRPNILVVCAMGKEE